MNICMSVRTRMYIRTYLCMNIYMSVCTCVCMYVRMYIRMYACMLVCMHACMFYACMYVLCTHSYNQVCMHVCVYVFCMYACIYVYLDSRVHLCILSTSSNTSFCVFQSFPHSILKLIPVRTHMHNGCSFVDYK